MVSRDDEEWLCRQPPGEVRVEYIYGPVGTAKEVVPGVTAVKLGGHFPGSLVLHWERQLFIADTFITVPVSDFLFSIGYHLHIELPLRNSCAPFRT